MILQFTFDQLRLLFRILGQDCRELRYKLSQTNDINLKQFLTSEEAAVEDLLERVIARQLQFRSDEQELKNRVEALERLLDKVVEACAML